jgi:hypothetical protein
VLLMTAVGAILVLSRLSSRRNTVS